MPEPRGELLAGLSGKDPGTVSIEMPGIEVVVVWENRNLGAQDVEIAVPLPHALDQDQLANATALAKAGGAIVIKQDDFTPARLAAEIAALAQHPARLVDMAAKARAAGALDAAERLADLVLRVANVVPQQDAKRD